MPLVLSEPPILDATVTVDTLVAEVYTHLEPSSFGYLNRLAEPVPTTDQTEFTFEFANQAAIKPGAYLCVDVEVVYVWDYDAVTGAATVQRGMLGSIPTDHDAGALVQVQPRVSKYDVVKQLRHDIRSLPPALFVVNTVEFSPEANVRGYELALANVTRILNVVETRYSAAPRTVSGWRYDSNADIDVYPSGKALIFPWAFDTSSVVAVTYASSFDTSSFNLDTPLAQIGLSETMFEIPVLGAAARLVREAPRTDTRAQGQSRLAEEVPPGHISNTQRNLFKLRDDRIHQEIARLRERFPQRRA